MEITIGTRGSKLALWQAEWVKGQIERLEPGLSVNLKIIKTTGDKILDVPLSKVGGKGLFVKEIEESLLNGGADIAVHSMKDVPVDFPDGLHLAAICEREDPRDAFIGRQGISSFDAMPDGAKLGTSSLRRSCQLLSIKPHLNIIALRGNLDTRLRKLDDGEFDAIILAAAGMKRLAVEGRITEMLPVEISLPAIGQGAIGIECRADCGQSKDKLINALVKRLSHEATAVCVLAERAFLKRLEGGCQVPIAAYATLSNSGKIYISGLVGSVDGGRMIRGDIKGDANDSASLGVMLAEDLIGQGAGDILREVYERR
ncbi:MAG: hydroxymethylbilane synthase [Candidatus Magnetominusculus sp. LBB02]|nr:hydroxymethylbilane synthase [Candidatus Magnetominusculus sp. LBB02]